MSFDQLKYTLMLLLPGVLAFGSIAVAADTNDLTLMLHEFLAGAGEAEVHDRFWAKDLVYTSSRGTRTTKAEIMQGFSESDSTESEEPGPVYAAEDIQIKVYGTTAVVAFRLVATPHADSSLVGADSVLNYFNTGTFLKRDGRWHAVVWQATRIPGP